MKSFSRKKSVVTALAVVACTFLMVKVLSACTPKDHSDPSLKGKKVLYVYGGWEGHDPKPSVDLFVPWLKSEGAEVIVSDNLNSYTDSALMSSVDLVIQIWTMGKITKEQEAGLLKAVRGGTGLAGWHGGTGDSFGIMWSTSLWWEGSG